MVDMKDRRLSAHDALEWYRTHPPRTDYEIGYRAALDDFELVDEMPEAPDISFALGLLLGSVVTGVIAWLI